MVTTLIGIPKKGGQNHYTTCKLDELVKSLKSVSSVILAKAII